MGEPAPAGIGAAIAGPNGTARFCATAPEPKLQRAVPMQVSCRPAINRLSSIGGVTTKINADQATKGRAGAPTPAQATTNYWRISL